MLEFISRVKVGRKNLVLLKVYLYRIMVKRWVGAACGKDWILSKYFL